MKGVSDDSGPWRARVLEVGRVQSARAMAKATHPGSPTFHDDDTSTVPSYPLVSLVTSIHLHWHLLKGTHSHLRKPILDLGKRGPYLGLHSI